MSVLGRIFDTLGVLLLRRDRDALSDRWYRRIVGRHLEVTPETVYETVELSCGHYITLRHQRRVSIACPKCEAESRRNP
jgi:hypothetical protein